MSNDLAFFASLPFVHARTALAARQRRADFDQVRGYVMFVGHPRSGSTLVGSLLNAHPDAVIGHELNALRYVRGRLGRDQLYQLICESDRTFTAESASKTRTGYAFAVEGMWQGRHRKMTIIGDKRAGTSTRALGARPALLDRLRTVVGVPVTLVHVVRNPWDNIATIAKRSDRALAEVTRDYFKRAATVATLESRCDPPGLTMSRVHHESLIDDASSALSGLCRDVGLEPEADYLAACSAIVYRSPHQSRHEATWPDGLAEEISERAGALPFLSHYRFDE
ncbi:MAG: sulfotransferase [Acidimicrobiales bacterium]